MIITEDDPGSPLKSQQAVIEASPQNGSEPPPPPAYSGPSNYATAMSIPSANPNYPLLSADSDDEPTEPAGRRFIKAFALAVLIYVALGVFTQGTIVVARRDGRRGRWIGIDPGTQIDHDQVGWPSPSDGKIVRCVNNQQGWFHEGGPALPSTSFELPLSADVLYLLSRGRLSSGVVHIIQDASLTRPDVVKVDVSLALAKKETLNRISVCLLERQEGHAGIGFFSPERWPVLPDRTFQFMVTVRLPISETLSTTRVSALETVLPNFSQYVDAIYDEVSFRSLSLGSSNGIILAESVSADKLEIKNTNGIIEGNFYSSDTLTLVTSNAHVRVNATLYHDGLRNGSTFALLRTSNGDIDSSVNLISTTRSTTGGSFKVLARTSNAPLTLDFPESSVDAHLDMYASTSNDPATVSMHPAFEGTFELRTSNAKLAVPFDQNKVDPAGRHRRRELSVSQRNKVVNGAVTWSGVADGKGHAEVRTSNGPVTLNLV